MRCIALIVFIVSLAASWAPALVSLEPLADTHADLTAPWIAGDDWLSSPATFAIGDENDDPSARGWVGVDETGVRVRVIVRDAFHVNTRSGGAIWDGDALQIGFDALAAGVGMRDRADAFVGPTVSAIAFALTDTGPQAWAHYHGRPGGAEDRPDLAPQVVRDDDAQTTTYDLLLPWSDYGLQAGVAGAIGLTIQVNDTDAEGSQRRIHFGGGAAGTPRPGLFPIIALAAPDRPLAGVSFTRRSLWRDGDPFEAIVAITGHEAAQLRIQAGANAPQIIDVPAGAARRFRLRATLDTLPHEPVPVEITLLGNEQVLATERANIDAPGRVMADLDTALRSLAASASSDLVARHFTAVRTLFAIEWNKAMLYTSTNPEMAGECVRYAQQVLSNLQNHSDHFTAQKYLAGERGMVFAFLGDDRNLDFYHVSLPAHFDASVKHPLIVNLHGSGNPHPLHSIAAAFAPSSPSTATSPATTPSARASAIRIAPWARGNYGYRDIAEADVMHALNDIRRALPVDPQRTYLMGHSLGGGGTWALALRRPDVWAAAAVCSGGTWFLPTDQNYGANAAHLPILIWHGETDGAVSVNAAYEMQKELEDAGGKPEMRIIPGRGHDFLPDDNARVTEWLLTHQRRRPDQFSYKAAPGAPRGCWGINMRTGRTGTPSFTCAIDGNTVRIDSADVSRFSVNLADGGLGLTGDVKVFLNGELAYEGPAKDIAIGE